MLCILIRIDLMEATLMDPNEYTQHTIISWKIDKTSISILALRYD